MKNQDKVKLTLKKNDYCIEIAMPVDKFNSVCSKDTDILKKTNSFIDYLSSDFRAKQEIERRDSLPIVKYRDETDANKTNTLSHEKDEFKIRERIPNNAVDVNNLEAIQARGENSLVRCPHCGQSHCMIIKPGPSSDSLFLRRNFETKEMELLFALAPDEVRGMLKRSSVNPLTYYESIIVLDSCEKSRNVAVESSSECLCPVCSESNSFENCTDAFYNPQMYFEHEPCPVCGEELVDTITKRLNNIKKCESCGFKMSESDIDATKKH